MIKPLKTCAYNIVFLLVLLPLTCFLMQPIQAQEDLALLCEEQPERVKSLFQALNLEMPELAAVREAVLEKDYPTACQALLAYYQERFPAGPAPEKKEGSKPAAAEAIMAGNFTFYGVTERIPTSETGGLDWTYRGRTDDPEWAWGLNRHGHLSALLGGWQATGDSRYIKRLNKHFADWVISSPYPNKKSNTAQWRGLEAALRLGTWERTFARMQHHPDFSPATLILMLSSLPDHADYLSKYHANRGNWVTMEMNGLARIALVWPEFRASQAWLDYAVGVMTPELEKQVYPDGAQKELTSHYHYVALSSFLAFAGQLEAHGKKAPQDYQQITENMWSYLAYSIRPNGYALFNNDSDYDYRASSLAAAAKRFGREDWRYIASGGTEGTCPTEGPSIFFPWAGHTVLRSGWTKADQWAFLDVGPYGTGHQQRDKLHLSIHAHGRDILVDAGRYTYVHGPFLDYFKSSSAHNLVLIDGCEQSKYAYTTRGPLEGVHAFTPEWDYVRGVYDDLYKGLEGKAQHQRVLVYLKPQCWIVVDRIETDRARDISTLWHFHPDCTVATEGAEVFSTDADKGNLRITPLGAQAWETELITGQEEPFIQGWYSPVYNQKVPCTCAVMQSHIEESATLVWLMRSALGAPAPLKARLLSANADHVRMEIALEEGKTTTLSIPLTGEPGLKKD